MTTNETANPGPHVLILGYHDRSGLIATWGPYPSHEAAEEGQSRLEGWPISSGRWEIKPLLTPLDN